MAQQFLHGILQIGGLPPLLLGEGRSDIVEIHIGRLQGFFQFLGFLQLVACLIDIQLILELLPQFRLLVHPDDIPLNDVG